MTTLAKLSKPSNFDAALERVSAITSRASNVAGQSVLSDQALIEVKSGVRQLRLITRVSDGKPLGFIAYGGHEFDLIIDPDFRKQGIGSFALDEFLNELDSNKADQTSALHTWVHGEDSAAEKLLSAHGFKADRSLLKLVLREIKPVPSADSPRGQDTQIQLRNFQESDVNAWVKLNAEVFAAHPEQSAITATDVADRMRESWFDAHNFILATNSSGEILGYCWLKVQPGASEGEVYVLGVSPRASGSGLGSKLFNAGLARLSEIGVKSAFLYVEAENLTALRIYQKSGFEIDSRSAQWSRIRS